MNLRDYWKALECGAEGRGLRALAVPAEIVIARVGYGIGPRFYSLYRLWRKPRAEWGEYVLDARKNRQLHRLYTTEQLAWLDDKVEFFLRCSAAGLPTVPVLGVIAQDERPDTSAIRTIGNAGELMQLIEQQPDGLFIKPCGGAHGIGALSVLLGADGVRCDGRVLSVTDLFQRCRAYASESRERMIVQPRLRPARDLREIMSPHGLGTVRAVTALHRKQARVLSACLRIPVGLNAADNFKHGASGNLVAAIDLGTGRLSKAFGSADRSWPRIVEVGCHPDSGGRFEGFSLPQWRAVVELVLAAQRTVSGLPTVGWDVAITESGPVLVEGNPASDADLLQVAHDCGLRSVLLEGLDVGPQQAT
jgi:hypothetical protein